MKIIYEAIAEDLTHLGGSMGTEYTTERSLGVFSSAKTAKKACQKHYGRPIIKGCWKPSPFHPEKPDSEGWIKVKDGWRTQDLSWVMYYIRERVVK